jgi:hypothetical protein
MYITNDTIATIRPEKSGFILTLYDNKQIYYCGFYKTLKAARSAQTKRTNNHFNKKAGGKNNVILY